MVVCSRNFTEFETLKYNKMDTREKMFELKREFKRETSLPSGLYTDEYIEWLEQNLVKLCYIPRVSKSVCGLIDTTCGYRSFDGKCNSDEDKCRQKQTVY